MNLPNFWYGSCSYDPLWENHTLYTGEILIWRIFGHGIAKFCPFKAEFWAYNFQTPLRIFLIFGRKLLLRSSLRKSYSICRENSDMVECWPFKTKIWPFFCQNWQFWEFFTYNFQTPLWIFLIFGMEVVFMVLFEKIILYMPGKFWYGEMLAI